MYCRILASRPIALFSLVSTLLVCVFHSRCSCSIIAKYFTLVHGSTFYSLIQKLRRFVIFLFFAQKIIIFVLVVLRLILLALKHLFIRSRSRLMHLFIFLSDLLALICLQNRRLVSLAK